MKPIFNIVIVEKVFGDDLSNLISKAKKPVVYTGGGVINSGPQASETLKEFDGKVRTCVTSPPYYGLRDYGTATWIGGDPNCDHRKKGKQGSNCITGHKNADIMGGVGDYIYKSVCPKCGAVRQDSQIGLEETPEEYIDNLVSVFRSVRDSLTDDGTCWVNLGDSYYNYRPGKGQSYPKQTVSKTKQDLPELCNKRGNKLEGLNINDIKKQRDIFTDEDKKNQNNSSILPNYGVDIKHNSYDRYLARKKSQYIKTENKNNIFFKYISA